MTKDDFNADKQALIKRLLIIDDEENMRHMLTSMFSGSDYQVDTASEPGRIKLVPGVSWPAVEADKVNAVQITYVAGYGANETDVPSRIRQAIEPDPRHPTRILTVRGVGYVFTKSS